MREAWLPGQRLLTATEKVWRVEWVRKVYSSVNGLFQVETSSRALVFTRDIQSERL